MSPNPKFLELLKGLKEATELGRIQWTETVSEHLYRVIMEKAIVRVGWSYDEVMENAHYSAYLVEKGGKVLEFISENADHDSILGDLYELARRQSHRTDDLLDELIGEVKSKVVR